MQRRHLGLVCAVLTVMLCSCRVVQAQAYWPSAAQWAAMERNVTKDPELKRVLERQRKLADAALQRTPQAIAVVSTAGRLEGDDTRTQSANALKDMEAIEALAIGYTVYHDSYYLDAARRYLLAWAAINQPTGQPIDETQFEPAIFAYRLVRPALDESSRHRIDQWWMDMARAEIRSRESGSRTTAINNWNSHRIKTVGLIGFAIGDLGLIDTAHAALLRQIRDNLNADGSGIDFAERDALSYHVYNLRPLVTLALAFSERGEDLFHWRADNGASIAGSVDWLMPFVRGEKNHAEFVGSKVPFDIARSRNHENGHEIGSIWQPANALPLLDLVAAYDTTMIGLSAGIDPKPRLRRIISGYVKS